MQKLDEAVSELRRVPLWFCMRVPSSSASSVSLVLSSYSEVAHKNTQLNRWAASEQMACRCFGSAGQAFEAPVVQAHNEADATLSKTTQPKERIPYG